MRGERHLAGNSCRRFHGEFCGWINRIRSVRLGNPPPLVTMQARQDSCWKQKLQRSLTTVGTRARGMPGQLWTNYEIEQLRDLLAQGLSASEMQIGSRSPAAIQNKAARLNFVGDGIPRKRWTAEAEALLKRQIVEGGTAAGISTDSGVLVGYSRNAIQKKLGRLSLIDRARSRRARDAVRLTAAQLDRFQTFLLAHASRCTPEQIALLWNREHTPLVTRRRVVYHLQKMGIKRSWAEVMQMPFSKAKQRRVSKKAAEASNKRWEAYRDQQESELRDLARKRRRQTRSRGKSLAVRACRDCNSRWPAVEPFYVLYEKQTASGRRHYLGRICRMCRNKRRRESKNLRRRGPATA